jgi:hypothetical protein
MHGKSKLQYRPSGHYNMDVSRAPDNFLQVPGEFIPHF